MEDASERTPLHGSYGAPMYVFTTNHGRIYRSRIRQFQCCICAGFLAMFILAVVITVSYSINEDFEDRNKTIPNATDSIAQQQLQVLLTASWPVPDAQPVGAWPQPGPSAVALEAALAAGEAAATAREAAERAMPALPLDTPSYRHQLAVATGARATALAEAGRKMVDATKYLVQGMARAPGARGPRVEASWQDDAACAEEDGVDTGGFPACPAKPSPWRRFDGRCNQPAQPWRGAALRPFRRVLPPAYADGVDAPRAAPGGAALPSAREVSLTVHRPQYRDDASFSVLLAVWGQFIDHDITATALSKRSTDGDPISCCYAVLSGGQQKHPECFPVLLGPEDPFFQQYNTSCMEFVRSAPAPACRFGPREQLNQATSFLDGSVVYGTSDAAADALREKSGGRLRMRLSADNRELLPVSMDPNDGCNRAEEAAKGRYCFVTGDARANENLHLTTLHLLLARQHNRLAAALRQRNPAWDDERLFQEARRVVAAQMQHITYSEFLPIVLGSELMEKLSLLPREEGYADDYDPDADPRVANVFAAAAFRFAHTLLPGLMRMISNSSSEYVELHKVLFNPFLLYGEGGEKSALRGALAPGLLRFDPHFSPQVSQHLFERDTPPAGPSDPSAPARPPGTAPLKPCGLDLVSLNIQRGRDHGLPAYPLWRRHCGLSEPKDFADLQGVLDDESLARIAGIYRSVDDIDPYTGMLAEVPLPGAMLGPTLTCIIADQFVRMRRGDRYWYETGEQPQAFSPEQLNEVRKTSLAQLLCDTSDAVTSIQRWVLRAPGDANPRVACSALPRPDLGAWAGAPDPSGGGGPSEGAARVDVGGGTARARPFGPRPAAPPSAPLDAGTALTRPLRLGGTVRAARVTSEAGRAWYGAFPLEIKLPLFDAVAGSADPTPATPTVYPHGILWQGAIAASSPGYLSLKGEFSMPRYVHGDALTNFTVEWLNGDFEFVLEVMWNTSDLDALNLQGSYSSPIYLGATNKYMPLQEQPLHKMFEVGGEFISTPSLDIDPVVKRAPIILFGTYSVDGTSFLWSGNVSAIIPDVVPVTPWSKSSYWSDKKGIAPFEHLPWVPRSPKVEALPATAGVSSAVGVSVTSGNITVDSNGTTMNWWDGKLPVDIPMPAFNRVVKASSKPDKADKGKFKPTFASGIVWDGSLQRKDNVTLTFQGNFSLPIFVHGPGALFSIDWKTGNFSLEMKLLWNATLDGVFQEGQNYSSPVFFRESKPSDTAADIIVGMQGSGAVEGSAELQFVAAGAADASAIPQAPLILLGSFSPDKTQFLWSGNATVILPAPAGPVQLQMSAAPVSPSDETTVKVTVGAEVIGGSIDAGMVGSTPSTVWNGDLPVPIRGLDLLARGINWNGQLTSSSLTEAQLEGTFLTVLPENPGAAFPSSPYQGKFSLQLSLLWNVSVDGLLPPDVPVYSPLYFRGAAASDDAEAWFAVDKYSSLPRAASAQNSAAFLTVPIILQGAYSADLTTFWWSGRVLLVFPSVSPTKMQQLILTKSRMPLISKPPLGSSFMVLPTDQNSLTVAGPPAFRPLRLGAFVSSGSITTSAGTAWSGKLPLQLSLPLFDSRVGPDGAAADVRGTLPTYAHGIIWEGTLTSTSGNHMTFSGEFSMPHYVHGGNLANFSIDWINGRFSFDLQVLWNSSDIDNFSIQGMYSSPVFIGARQRYSHLQDVPAGSLSDASSAIKRSPSITPTPELKRAPITLLGSYSADGMSFIWSGNVSVLIPDVIPVPTWNGNALWSEINGAYPPGQLSSSLRATDQLAIPSASSALGVSVTNANVSLLTNGSYVSWWNGTLPLSITIPTMKNEFTYSTKSDKYSKVKPKPKPSYAAKLIWNATLQREDITKLRLTGNFSVPTFINGPGALFTIDWKTGNFSIDFKLRWNTTLDNVFQKGKNYYSPVFVRASKPSDAISDIITDIQWPKSMKNSPDPYFEAASSRNTSAIGRAPIILHGTFSPDQTKFLWYGNATIILPKPPGNVFLEMAAVPSPATGPPGTAMRRRVTIGAEVLDGDLAAGPSGSSPSRLWSGEIPVPIRRPELLARGVTWKGEFSQTSLTDVQLTGTFSALWTSAASSAYPFSVYDGKFSAKLALLWNVSVASLLPAGATVYSPVYLRGTTVPNITGEWLEEVENNPETTAAELAQPEAILADLRVPVILQGTYSPDLTTFWWTGRVILAFPQPTPTTVALEEISAATGTSVGATVTAGSVTAADGTQLWDGALPLVLPGALGTVVWNGALTPSVGGTVELRGAYYGRGGSGEFALVLSPLWSTPLAGHVVAGRNYTSPLFLREPADPAPRQAAGAVSGGKVPVILQGSFAPDKSTFSWSGNVIIAFP